MAQNEGAYGFCSCRLLRTCRLCMPRLWHASRSRHAMAHMRGRQRAPALEGACSWGPFGEKLAYPSCRGVLEDLQRQLPIDQSMFARYGAQGPSIRTANGSFIFQQKPFISHSVTIDMSGPGPKETTYLLRKLAREGGRGIAEKVPLCQGNATLSDWPSVLFNHGSLVLTTLRLQYTDDATLPVHICSCCRSLFSSVRWDAKSMSSTSTRCLRPTPFGRSAYTQPPPPLFLGLFLSQSLLQSPLLKVRLKAHSRPRRAPGSDAVLCSGRWPPEHPQTSTRHLVADASCTPHLRRGH